MDIKELNKKYDKLQQKHGAEGLNAIYNGGCENSPDVMFVFMNPTGTNIASSKSWNGRRSPWLGTKNIWKLFYNVKLLDESIYNEIQGKKAKDWNEEFADLVYANIERHKYFVTNLGKCTQVDARYLPDYVYKEYLDLLYKEIDIVKPKKIITFGNQVSSILLGEKINVSKCRKKGYQRKIGRTAYDIFPTYYPIGNGMRNIDKAIEDINYLLKN